MIIIMKKAAVIAKRPLHAKAKILGKGAHYRTNEKFPNWDSFSDIMKCKIVLSSANTLNSSNIVNSKVQFLREIGMKYR